MCVCVCVLSLHHAVYCSPCLCMHAVFALLCSVGDNSGNLPPPPPPPPEPQPPLVEPPLPSPPPPIQHSENGGPVKYFPSETFKMVQETEKGSLGGEAEDKTAHSRSFLKLQKHLDRWGMIGERFEEVRLLL